MKKYITYLIAMLILSLSLCFPAAAEKAPITFSEDFNTLYYQQSYTRFDASSLNFELQGGIIDDPIQLSANQQMAVDEVELREDMNEVIIHAMIKYHDGSTLYVYYLREDYIAEYQQLREEIDGDYTVDFAWPEENIVVHGKDAFFGKKTTVSSDTVSRSHCFTVYVDSRSGALALIKGELLLDDGEYYFLSYEENDIDGSEELYSGRYESFTVWEITDAELLEKLDQAESAYYDEDVGFLYDDELGEVITAVAMIFVFAVLPFGAMITFLVLAIRTTKLYRKLSVIICILSAIEISVFSLIAAIIMIAQ